MKADLQSEQGKDKPFPPHGSVLQRAAINEAPVSDVPPIVNEVVKSPGQPLDTKTRAFFEPRFGHDFSGVRVHTDTKAAESAQAVNASAYTLGSNIAFGNGQYNPRNPAGQRLIAHELTHVLQQRGQLQSKNRISNTEDPSEHEADKVANSLVPRRGKTAPVGAHAFPLSLSERSVTAIVQRQETTDTDATEDSDSSEERDASPRSPDSMTLEAPVGVRGENRIGDVTKVQARLVAIGLLSREDMAAEMPDAGETVTSSIPEAALTKTIAAICEYQRPLLSGNFDGNIGPNGPTWLTLRTDTETIAKKRADDWRKKQQQIADERIRKQKADEERKKLEAEARDKKAIELAPKLIEKHTTLWWLNRNALAGELVMYAKSDSKVVFEVFRLLYWKVDDIIAEMFRRTPVADLASLNNGVLELMRYVVGKDQVNKRISESIGTKDAKKIKKLTKSDADQKLLELRKNKGNKKAGGNTYWSDELGNANWGGWCASGVRMLFEAMTDIKVAVPSGIAWGPKMRELIADNKVPYREENNPNYESLPDGSVLVWTQGGKIGDTEYGHVCTVVEGLWVSDFYSPPKRQMGGAPHPNIVFVPTDSE